MTARFLLAEFLLLSTLLGCGSFPKALPVSTHPDAGERELVIDDAARARGAEMRVHVLHVGDTLVSYDQFFSGNDGAVGFPGLWRMKTDERKFWAPVQCALLVHPTEGPILVDTCVSREQGEPGYYEGLAANVHSDDINRIPTGKDLVTQLAALGFSAEDVKHVVVTHLHEDHVGELNRFPNATLHIAKAEWDNREHSPLFTAIYYEKNWAKVKTVVPAPFADGRFGPFAAAEDLFGDGSVILLPTLGHTPGHASVLVNSGAYDVVLSGDAFYTLRHLDPASLSAFGAYDEEWQALYRDSLTRLVGLRRYGREVHLVAQHDPFPETQALVLAAYADGRLSDDERAQLLAHERSFYDSAGRLLPDASPRYEPGSSDDGYGTIVGPRPRAVGAR